MGIRSRDSDGNDRLPDTIDAVPATALERLAETFGIEAGYRDARGRLKTTSEVTRRALLEAMGVTVADEQSARAALAQEELAEWSRVLDPVYVLHQAGGPASIPIVMQRAAHRFHWKISTEAGDDREGDADFSALASGTTSRINPAVERRHWELPIELPCGYHQLSIDGGARSVLIVAPSKCWMPAALDQGRRLWGLSVQLYLLRSRTNWGIGDYSDLKQLVETMAALGAHVIGINPLHALFADDPEQASPYSPASRLLLNVLNIDVAEVARQTPEFNLDAALQDPTTARLLKRCRESALVDYTGVLELKLGILEGLFASWLGDPGAERWRAFERFRREAGDAFARDVTFMALREHFAGAARADWHHWPPAYQRPGSPEVQRFAAEHHERLTFQACLQYWADTQLAACMKAASGMCIGLYRDLAVGANDAGAETWGSQTAVVRGVHVGAPPDIHNPAGQQWGLPPFNPRALRGEAYLSFIELIRANMRHAGGLRIDHVMGLQHLYCVPAGWPPSAGAYLRYPIDDLIGILKLESQRHRCLIVGEDLGTVPDGFRERMAEAGIFSYRVLFFERDETAFRPAADYPLLAVAVVGSHDLPTLRAWWSGSDLALKERLHLYPGRDDAQEAHAMREHDRAALVDALRAEGLVRETPKGDPPFDAVHAFLAGTQSALAMVQLDEITDEETPVNVPNTSAEHPNWRRKYRLDLDAIRSSARLARVAELFNAARN